MSPEVPDSVSCLMLNCPCPVSLVFYFQYQLSVWSYELIDIYARGMRPRNVSLPRCCFLLVVHLGTRLIIHTFVLLGLFVLLLSALCMPYFVLLFLLGFSTVGLWFAWFIQICKSDLLLIVVLCYYRTRHYITSYFNTEPMTSAPTTPAVHLYMVW